MAGLAAAAALIAGAAAANEPACYARAYSAGHLAANPAQTVERLTVAISRERLSEHHAGEAAITARFRGDPETYRQWLVCWEPGALDGAQPAGAIVCGVECDGGHLAAWERGDGALLLRTEGFLVSGTCAEPGEDAPVRWVKDAGPGETTFLLHPAAPALCAE